MYPNILKLLFYDLCDFLPTCTCKCKIKETTNCKKNSPLQQCDLFVLLHSAQTLTSAQLLTDHHPCPVNSIP